MDLGNASENLLINKNEHNKYQVDERIISITNENDSLSIICRRIEDNTTVLDVGCAVGYLGEILNKAKNCIVYGIEIDDEARIIAEKKNCYKDIYNFSVTDKNDNSYKNFFKNEQKYDYIVFADILEHLYDPDLVILNFMDKLKDNGKILISLPNIAHLDIIKHLIDRKFNYNTVGLLDNTHIRFFTKQSFIQMIDSINKKYNIKLEVNTIGNTIVIPGYIDEYPNIYNLLNEDHELCVLQYIFELKKSNKSINYSYDFTNNFSKIEYLLNERNKILTEYSELEQKYKEQINKMNSEFNQIKNEFENQILEKEKESKIKISKNENTIKKLTNEQKQLIESKKILEEEIIIMQNTLNQLQNSKSWKITKPLRKISQLITKNKKNK